MRFAVPRGEVYGLLGPNGAGKTTTLRMLLGLLPPTRGEAFIAGYSSTQQPDEVKRRVGLVAASAGMYQWLSVREMLLFFADLSESSRKGPGKNCTSWPLCSVLKTCSTAGAIR